MSRVRRRRLRMDDKRNTVRMPTALKTNKDKNSTRWNFLVRDPAILHENILGLPCNVHDLQCNRFRDCLLLHMRLP